MRKTSIRLLLLTAVIICLGFCTALAETFTVEIDGVTYTVDGKHITAVSGGTEGASLVVPSEINGVTITGLAEAAFEGTTFGSITLPDSITFFGVGVFRDCAQLVSIDLPDNLDIVNPDCFKGCSSLKSIDIPDTLTFFSTYGTFYGCSSLKSVVLPDCISNIGTSCFQYCTSLEQVTVPEGITRLSYYAFADCTSLKSVIIPASVTTMDRYVFDGCSSLESIALPDSITVIPELTFAGCSSLKSVKLPANLTAIENQAFAQCRSLTSIDLPDTLTTISSYIFQGCGITELALPSSLTYIAGLALSDCYTLKKVTYTVPDDMTELPDNLFKAPGLVITISQDSPLLSTVAESGVTYILAETGETGNVVDDTITTLDEKVDAIVAAVVMPGMSDYQKALVLHNWVIRNADYDETYTYYDADGVLLYGTGVCQSYALAYRLLMNEVGIPNCLEYGTDHVWNMIQLGDGWYHVDLTWDDPIGGGPRCDYFGLSNLALEGVSNHECFNKPQIAEAYEYNYYYRSGAMDELMENNRRQILNHLSQGKTIFSFSPEGNCPGYSAITALLAMQDTAYELHGCQLDLAISFDRIAFQYTVTLNSPAAPDLVLPGDLTGIEAEAFAGTAFAAVQLDEGLTFIGAGAFQDCPNLWQIEIPASVTSIDATAFAGVNGLIILGQSGSTAESFASEHGYGFMALD